jgi:hypothetical protein
MLRALCGTLPRHLLNRVKVHQIWHNRVGVLPCILSPQRLSTSGGYHERLLEQAVP